ncbi:ArnT family glycosyltransferase [Anaerolinea thermophila]|uniref:Hypothetical membrane protein n=1 Tax=Anaerolinea thermophila (strain DSM 14523 / JCM 11388 / NBRC 100420 / UNI-1) TaxID=926569 RepID=E8MXI0_ANATU|nr:glycosyltransferase family 39 protein [Anaerolinea thermophila]BAJ64061.1 hypothetical membrane protein [Anaerolinea thermophila UNI-1]
MRRSPLFWICTLAVILRVGVAVYLGNTVEALPGVSDQLSYHHLAIRVVEGHGFSFDRAWWPATRAGEPTAHWSFLYTFYLAGIYALFGVHPVFARILQAILVGILQPWLSYWVGKQIFGHKVGVWAAFLNAIYLYFIYYSGTLMTEPFYITAILGVLALTIQLTQSAKTSLQQTRTAILLGLVYGIAVLLRQLFLLFLPFLILWIFIKNQQEKIGLQWWHGVISLGVILVMILPFTLYNYQRFGEFVLLNTNSGYAFYWANHPYYGTKFIPILSEEEYLNLLPEELLSLNEAALDKALLSRGIQFVLDDPVRYGMLSLSRIPPYFDFLPRSESGWISNITRVFSFGVFFPFMLVGLFLAIKDTFKTIPTFFSSPPALLILFSIVYIGIHVLTWTLVRYRLPVDAVWLIFAGLTFVRISARMFHPVSKP